MFDILGVMKLQKKILITERSFGAEPKIEIPKSFAALQVNKNAIN